MDTGPGSPGAGELPRGPRNLSGFPPPRSQPPSCNQGYFLSPMNYERSSNPAVEPNAPGLHLIPPLFFSGPAGGLPRADNLAIQNGRS